MLRIELFEHCTMFIPDQTVEEVRAASDVTDVVGDYVRLKRRGSNYFGLCPFHSENTPSFSVNPGLGIYKCFGCGAGGDVFNFIMSVEGIAFPEAVRMLAKKAGIEIADTDVERERLGESEAVYNALRFAARYYFNCLTQTPQGKHALDYLLGRGFTSKTIRSFGLGYSFDGWDGLLNAAGENHIPEHILEQAGLVIARKDGNGFYDRFRGRIMFPIFSHVGKVLGFGGRILNDEPDLPKYINSPETRVYNKSRVLYGLSLAKQAIRKREEVLLVEGYTDVIALHQAGVDHTVASSGTSLTHEQVKLLSRYARRVVLLFDADTAGAGAAVRGIDITLEEGLSAYVVALPPGEDPDSFSRNEKGSIESYLREHRRDFATYIYERAKEEGRFETPEGEAGVMHDIVNAIARLQDPLIRETYLKRAGELLGLPDSRLHEALDMVRSTERKRSRPARRRDKAETQDQPRSRDNGERRTHIRKTAVVQPLPEEKSLIRMMLEHGSPMVEFILGNMSLDEFTPGAARAAAECLLSQYEQGAVERQDFLNGTFGPEVQRLAAEVSVVLHEPSENWERKQKITVPKLDSDPYEAAVSAMMLLKLDRVNAAIDKQREEMYRASVAGDELQPLQTQMMALHELRRRIERKEFLQE
jgi:DNA primase